VPLPPPRSARSTWIPRLLGLALVSALLLGAHPEPTIAIDTHLVVERAARLDPPPLGRPEGFAAGTTGGQGGPTIWVTSLADTGVGTLREAVSHPGPIVVRFAVEGTITLVRKLVVGSNTTIDARGTDVTITGRGLRIAGVSNVIVTGLRIGGVHDQGTEDAISVLNGAHHIWIDHNELWTSEDGLIDITLGATDVTVSWNRFTAHDKVMLVTSLAGQPSSSFRVTLHHNLFEGTSQRHPLIRNARVHAYNNVVRDFQLYGMQSSTTASLWSQGNVFQAVAGSTRRQALRSIDNYYEDYGAIRSDGDLLLNGATTTEMGRATVSLPAGYQATVEVADTRLLTAVTTGAGRPGIGARSGGSTTGTGSGTGSTGTGTTGTGSTGSGTMGSGTTGSTSGTTTGGAGAPTTASVAAPTIAIAATAEADGYWLATEAGEVDAFGRVDALGEASLTEPGAAAAGLVATPTGAGYWLVGRDGGVFTFGDATFFGSTGGTPLNRPIIGAAPTPSGEGYWLVASDGGIFSFGDARFHGSTGAIALNQPIVGAAATPTGAGYWLVARDGGIFAFGDATFFGSTGAITLNQPIVGMAATPSGAGYWLVARDGGIFAFGDATFFGSTGAITLNQPIVGMAATPTGDGYWLVARDGGIFSFGDATYHGSSATR
jgi:pectate lyase